ncbi:MAG: AbrB/MazE/SpoVT family DNA-binding domain-containing protein [Candidatus Paceibacterota bacterium]
MGRREQEDHHIRNIAKVGQSSYAVTLPIELVRELGWQVRQKVTVTKWGKSLLITDWEE